MSDWVAETKSFAMSGNDGSEQSSADSLPPGKVTVAEFRNPPTPSPPGGQVTLRCGRRGEPVRAMRAFIEVEDDGPGVPVGEYTRLTQRFYRVPGATAEGTGLGLAIAEEIAQEHGATLVFSPGDGQRGLKVQLVFGE